MTQDPFEMRFVTIHGYRRAYVVAGEGPVLLLLHGMGCDHTTWSSVIGPLSRRYTVIAPDLLGHGSSAKPRADYSVAAYANGMRDLVTVLGVDRVTVVGHSFGGGVAMQFAYQFPERTERMILVASGGLGAEVHAAVRAVTLPGFHQVMHLLTRPGLRHLAMGTLRGLAATGLPHTRDLDEIAGIVDQIKDPAARWALRRVVSGVVDWRGQSVTMVDRAYLTQAMPMCVIWGTDDDVIPVRHAGIAAEVAPSARVEIVANAAHFPHKDHPQRFVKIVHDFVRTTEPATYRRDQWRALLKAGHPLQVSREEASSGKVVATA